jgi:hypothetical protein
MQLRADSMNAQTFLGVVTKGGRKLWSYDRMFANIVTVGEVK